MANPFARPSIALAAASLLWCGSTVADPGYYVVTVYDDPGVRTVDFRYWDVRRPGKAVRPKLERYAWPLSAAFAFALLAFIWPRRRA